MKSPRRDPDGKRARRQTSDPIAEPDDPWFAAIVAALCQDPRVEPPSDGARGARFGAKALKVSGKIFAMMVRGRLVVKLPEERVDALVSSHQAERFDLGGRHMREWAALGLAIRATWLAFAQESRDFVAGDAQPRGAP